MAKALAKQIRVVDSNALEYNVIGTHWASDEFGVVTVYMNNDKRATFVHPAMIGFDGQVDGPLISVEMNEDDDA